MVGRGWRVADMWCEKPPLPAAVAGNAVTKGSPDSLGLCGQECSFDKDNLLVQVSVCNGDYYTYPVREFCSVSVRARFFLFTAMSSEPSRLPGVISNWYIAPECIRFFRKLN